MSNNDYYTLIHSNCPRLNYHSPKISAIVPLAHPLKIPTVSLATPPPKKGCQEMIQIYIRC